jgi:hypothetical protein
VTLDDVSYGLGTIGGLSMITMESNGPIHGGDLARIRGRFPQ